MLRWLTIAICALVLATPSSAQQTEAPRRIALLIGNAAYGPAVGPLVNPPNDVRILGRVLTDLGFDVKVEANLSANDFRVSLADYVQRLSSAGDGAVGFFFYGGHGLSDEEGVPFLIPIDAQNIRERSTWAVSLRLEDDVLNHLARARNASQIVIFDACRNEIALPEQTRGGRGGGRGFARVATHAQMVVAYSTSEGDVASDGVGSPSSPYAAALADALTEPGASLRDVFTSLLLPVRQATDGDQSPTFDWRLEHDLTLRPDNYSSSVRGVVDTSANGAPLIWFAPNAGACRSDRANAQCWPWNATLRIRDGQTMRYHCAGAAITSRHVLTSAECIQRLRADDVWRNTAGEGVDRPGVAELVIGADDLTRLDPAQVFTVARVITHPAFQSLGGGADVAILELDRNWSGPTLALHRGAAAVPGARLAFAGYGARAADSVPTLVGADGMQFQAPGARLTGDVEIVELDESCAAELSTAQRVSALFSSASGFCTRSLPERGTCDGDGGGVMIGVSDTLAPVGVGVINFGKGETCGEPRNPTYQTRLSSVAEWIAENAPNVTFAELARSQDNDGRRSLRRAERQRVD